MLMGDLKRKGKLYSMLVDIAKPGTLGQIVIKMQHNCTSDTRTYSGKFIPILHEYVMICRKDSELFIPVAMTIRRNTDIRELMSPTWKDIVYETMKSIGRSCRLNDLYERIDGCRRARENIHWQEKIRQTLQIYPQFFRNEERGVWSLAA